VLRASESAMILSSGIGPSNILDDAVHSDALRSTAPSGSPYCTRGHAMTIMLALLTSALWGLADFGAGLLSRRMASARVVVLSQGAAALGLAAVVAATGAYTEAGPRLWFAVGAGIVGPVALLCFYEALARGPMGVVSPLASAGVVIPVTVGLAVNGDRPGLL